MYKTEKDLLQQHVPLLQTWAHLTGNASVIKDFLGLAGFYSVAYIGSGINYYLSQSAEISLKSRGGLTSMSFSAGDLLINFPDYLNMLNGALMIASSRSGQTTEVLSAVEKAKREAGALCIAITTAENSKLSGLSDLATDMPWAADETIAPTHSIPCMYLANLYIISLLAGNDVLQNELKAAIDDHEAFTQRIVEDTRKIASMTDKWDHMFVLADGELHGVGGAGALTMQRICHMPAFCGHLLDARHGQINYVGDKTLIVAATSSHDDAYQSVLLRELRLRGATIVTLSTHEDNVFGADLNITLPKYTNAAIAGLPVSFFLQALSLYRAIAMGMDPDASSGDEPFVRL